MQKADEAGWVSGVVVPRAKGRQGGRRLCKRSVAQGRREGGVIHLCSVQKVNEREVVAAKGGFIPMPRVEEREWGVGLSSSVQNVGDGGQRCWRERREVDL